jgi:hypothetical protein
MQSLCHIHFDGAELLTGLPEYRNGGLFVDTGVLTLKERDMKRGLENWERAHEGQKAVEVVPAFAAGDAVVVEWRAVTVGFLDLLLEAVNEKLGFGDGGGLSLVQMLEAGSWKVSFFDLELDWVVWEEC